MHAIRISRSLLYAALFAIEEPQHPELLLHHGISCATSLRLVHVQRAQRHIGVIYRPDTERWSQYIFSSLPGQFDTLIHVNVSHALQPLDPDPGWIRKGKDLPETFRFGE
jgi:hypothetical protein